MGFSAKLFEVVLYADSYNFDDLKEFLDHKSGLRHYAYIIHDQDGKKEHCHVMLRMNNSNNSDYVAKWFNAKSNQVEKCKGRWGDMLAYLTHSNSPKKFQYAPDLVISNFEWEKEVKKIKNGNGRVNEIIEKIVDGSCREYNYTDYITAQEYIKYKVQIDRSYQYRIDKLKKVERKMEVIYIFGQSGAGKTTYAKHISAERNLIPFVSGGSNDPLDGYRGEDCLILDDLRASSMKISDLLKLLDNHTGSLVKSRYKNKLLECSLVIITSVRSISDLYEMFKEQDEPLMQLERRCQTLIKMTKDNIFVSFWDSARQQYVHAPSLPNFVLDFVKPEKLTQEQVLHKLKNLVDGSIDFDKAIKSNSFKDAPAIQKVEKVFHGAKVSLSKVPF